MSLPDLWELVARQFENPASQWATPGQMAQELDHRVKQVPFLDLLDSELVRAWNTPDSRLIISVGPQSGKSERAVVWYSLWCLAQNPDTRIAVASYSSTVARRWGRRVRDTIYQNQERLPHLRVRDDVSAQSEWLLDESSGIGGMYTVGVGGSLTGRPVDLLVIDDPVKDAEQGSSTTYQERTWDWWNSTAQTRLSPGAPVILIQTRWSTADLSGKLLSEHPDEWRYVRVPAEADHRPEHGEEDPLGREPGEWLTIPSGRTVAQWEKRKANTDVRTFAALYQGRPTPDEGGVFPRTDGWARYDAPHHVERNGYNYVPGVDERADMEMLTSWDLAFKDSKRSDYVVGQVWLRISGRAYLLDQVRGQMNFGATERAIRDLREKWPQAGRQVLIEDKANGPAIISHLRQEIPGIIPVEPQGSKYARAQAITPFIESGNVILPETRLMPVQMNVLMDEILSFPHGANDDAIDTMTQAVKALLIDNLERSHIGDIYEPFEYDEPHIDPVLTMY